MIGNGMRMGIKLRKKMNFKEREVLLLCTAEKSSKMKTEREFIAFLPVKK